MIFCAHHTSFNFPYDVILFWYSHHFVSVTHIKHIIIAVYRTFRFIVIHNLYMCATYLQVNEKFLKETYRDWRKAGNNP